MRIKTLKDCYDECVRDGLIRKKEDVDVELAKSLLDSAKTELSVCKETEKKTKHYFIICQEPPVKDWWHETKVSC